jgi:hypothetical protein
VGECSDNTGEETCSAGTWGGDTCDPFDGSIPEGPAGDATCQDTQDNDCDGLTDLGDSDCLTASETNCFDGIDNDGDGPIDCADSDCDGATDSTCDTGEPGMCAAGTWQCRNNAEECLSDYQPLTEGPPVHTTCNDTQDNDCDGLADRDDQDCHFYMGDIDEDGVIDISDAILVLRMALGVDTYFNICADMDNSGAVEISDVTATLQIALGVVPPLMKCNGGI